MKQKKKKIASIISTILLVGVVFTMTSCLGFGHHGKKMHDDYVEFFLFKITKELDLNESQQNFLKETVKELKQNKEELHKDKSNHVKKLKNLINSDYITENELEELFEEKHKEMETIKEKLISKIVEFHSTLTKEQKSKVIKLIDKHAKDFDK
jgi:periplasmic protein CpxP/Spy